MEKLKIVVSESKANMRLDRYVADEASLSRAAAQKLIEDGNVTVAGKKVAKSYFVQCEDEIEVLIPTPTEIEAVPQDIPICVVYEDDQLLVVDKQRGMVVHPAAGNVDGTLVNALLYHCANTGLSVIGGKIRPGIVHRIDKDTSGLLVVAKNDDAHKHLAQQFAQHSIDRVYHAVVHGRFKEDSGTVDAFIARSRLDRKKMAVAKNGGKRAVTHWQVQERYTNFTYLKLQLETGRTHQIRVHMAHIGHPLAGDMVYGPKKGVKQLQGQCLHAGKLGFIHPKSGEYIGFESPLPEYFTSYLNTINKN